MNWLGIVLERLGSVYLTECDGLLCWMRQLDPVVPKLSSCFTELHLKSFNIFKKAVSLQVP